MSMNFVFATLLWVAGSTLVALSFQQVARANPDERIPMAWGRPRHHPGEAYAYRAIAFLLWGFAVVTWGEVLGLWSVLLIFVGAIPTGVLNVRHNRRIQARISPPQS
ncbi:MAG: hypothetical protein ACTH1B_08610 [Yaniella sp.]